jgi:LuxR family transcriptional regulator, maltose regulon positive regulatory protein
MVMASPLLETKLFIPTRRRGLVARPRLSERLNRGTEAKLTLISAPAGFGKTTLLADWLEADPANGRSTAWLSLEQSDNDPALFWTYLITALQTAAPTIGAGPLSLLHSSQSPIEVILAELLNDLSTLAAEVVLALDDYHVIDTREVNDEMVFLLDHLPPQIHLVIASRADPALPLARMRSRGELVEIRAAELRFTPDETAAYLNDAMGLKLTAQDVAALEGRTEGWIAALQLAALSMQGREDVAGFIAGFAGDDRYIVDYLAEEVLQRQPEHVRHFLLQTSILDRLSGPLCDAVTGQDGGRAMLEALERENLFLVPLDDRRRWYRYHHLFADVLQAHLLDEQPDRAPELHRRASVWFEQDGESSEAIRHALAAEDFERAADLTELALPALRRGRQEGAIRNWVEALPDELLRVRPVLNVGFVGALVASGEFEGVEARLRDAERCVQMTTNTGDEPEAAADVVVVDEEQFRSVPGAIELYRAAQALVRGDVLETVRHARRTLELAPEDDHLGRAGAAGLMGLAFWSSGDLEEGHLAYSQCVRGLQRIGHVSDVMGCSIALADIRRTQGRLRGAMRTYEQALQQAAEQGGSLVRGTADMYVGIRTPSRTQRSASRTA